MVGLRRKSEVGVNGKLRCFSCDTDDGVVRYDLVGADIGNAVTVERKVSEL